MPASVFFLALGQALCELVSGWSGRTVAITVLAVVLSLSPVSQPPVASESQAVPPTPEEIMVLEEVRQWVHGGAPEEFRAVRSADLAAAVRSHRQSFDLFRSYSDKSAARRRLSGIPYGDLIESAAARHRVDGILLAAIVEAESSFDPLAISPVGALGLMQVMPDTASLYGVSDPTDPRLNIEVGARYVSSLLEQFDGDLELVLAAYNAGPGAVNRFAGVPPYRETRSYVRRVLRSYVDHHQAMWESSGTMDWLL